MPDHLVEQIKTRVQDSTQQTPMEEKFGSPTTFYEPVSLAQLEAAEQGIGFRLPELVRELYLQVGNGGFGPGYGIIGLEDGRRVYDETLVASYENYRDLKRRLQMFTESAPEWDWGASWIIYGYWGDNLTTVLDCGDVTLPIYSLDALTLKPHSSKTLPQWWQDWLDGTIKGY